MEEFRKRIDDIDDEIMRLISERVDIADEIGKKKMNLGLPVKNEKREATVISHYSEFAKRNGLNEELMMTICKALIALAIERENE